MHDIVYFVKDTSVNEELRYSLRTLHNFPHRKVWFYGGCYLSTDDNSFNGATGNQIRQLFPHKCQYEE